MIRAFEQVMLTYARRAATDVGRKQVLACFFLALAPYFIPDEVISDPLIYLVFLYPVTLVLMHIREQFADSRARTIPGFAKAHVLGAALMLLAAVIVPVIGLMTSEKKVFLGVTLFLVVFLPLLVGFEVRNIYLILSAAMVVAGFVIHIAFGSLDVITAPSLSLILIYGVFSVPIIFFGLLRLFNLHEEMPEYHRVLNQIKQTRIELPVGESDIQPDDVNLLMKLFSGMADSWTMRRLVSLKNTDNAGYHQWQLKFRPVKGVWVLGVGLGLAIVGLLSLSRYLKLESWTIGLLMFAIPASTAMTVIAGASNDLWRTIEMELLRPVSRSKMIRQIGSYLAEIAIRSWFEIAVPILACLAILMPQFVREHLAGLVGIFLIAFAGHIFSFGLIVWQLRHRSQGLMPILMLTGFVGYVSAALFVEMYKIQTTLGDLPKMATVALCLVLAGMAFTFDAYRRWLRTELG